VAKYAWFAVLILICVLLYILFISLILTPGYLKLSTCSKQYSPTLRLDLFTTFMDIIEHLVLSSFMLMPVFSLEFFEFSVILII
jgi:hypothetical protein